MSFKEYIYSRKVQFNYANSTTSIILSRFIYEYNEILYNINIFLFQNCLKNPIFIKTNKTFVFKLQEFPDLIKKINYHEYKDDFYHFIYIDIDDIKDAIEEFRIKAITNL
jgi:hypothetical protein